MICSVVTEKCIDVYIENGSVDVSEFRSKKNAKYEFETVQYACQIFTINSKHKQSVKYKCTILMKLAREINPESLNSVLTSRLNYFCLVQYIENIMQNCYSLKLLITNFEHMFPINWIARGVQMPINCCSTTPNSTCCKQN